MLVKITIDTKEDSKDDIRRVIALLSQVADNSSGFENSSGQRNFDIFSDNSSSASSSVNSSTGSNAPSQSSQGSLGVFSMFGDSEPSGKMANDTNSSAVKDDTNKIETYGNDIDDIKTDDFKIVPY